MSFKTLLFCQSQNRFLFFFNWFLRLFFTICPILFIAHLSHNLCNLWWIKSNYYYYYYYYYSYIPSYIFAWVVLFCISSMGLHDVSYFMHFFDGFKWFNLFDAFLRCVYMIYLIWCISSMGLHDIFDLMDFFDGFTWYILFDAFLQCGYTIYFIWCISSMGLHDLFYLMHSFDDFAWFVPSHASHRWIYISCSCSYRYRYYGPACSCVLFWHFKSSRSPPT